MVYLYMLFRTSNGILIEIKKYNFSNDKIYYEKIMEIKKSSKLEKTHNHIFKYKKNE
jgi:hypothetical protein